MGSRSRTYTFGEQGYTFGDENVYVSGTKRIRLGQVPNLPPQATVLSHFVLTE